MNAPTIGELPAVVTLPVIAPTDWAETLLARIAIAIAAIAKEGAGRRNNE
jgi:hypothetical protein